MFDLSGKVALVTGAGRGIGAGIAKALAGQGAKVAVNDYFEDRAISTAAEINDSVGQAMPAPFDATDKEAAESAISKIEENFGSIDILVNNVGVLAQGMVPVHFLDTSDEHRDQLVNLNLYGMLHSTRRVLEGMREKKWGRIIWISSEAVKGHPGSTIYGAMKGAGEAFMRSLCQEVAADGITANSISLGLINTVPEEWRKGAEKNYITGRIGTPEDVAAAAVYLASKEASWVLGHTLVVSG